MESQNPRPKNFPPKSSLQLEFTSRILHFCNSIATPPMLCSIPTGKSGSKWLDRLRSSKGFPDHNDLDLEQFLSNSSDSKPSDPNIGPEPKKPVVYRNQTTPETPRENGEREWLGIMSNVLSELFNMGEKPDDLIRGKKSSRKQSNPRICVVSTNVETMPSSGENSCADLRQTSERLRVTREENVDVEEDENCHGDMSGFSRTEVTVIDSSCLEWKCEKLLFRRKNVWRVREKKGRIRVGVKKRKGRPLEEESGGGEKKQKRVNLSKDAVDGESHTMMASDNVVSLVSADHGRIYGGQTTISNEVLVQSDKMNKGQTDTPDFVRFPRKSKKCGSSAILVKNVPTNKKSATNIPRAGAV